MSKIIKKIFNRLKRVWTIIRLSLSYFICKNDKKILLNVWITSTTNGVLHNNWGDDINYYFLSLLTNKKIYNYSDLSRLVIRKSTKNVLCIGSIIESHCNRNSIIWGSGAMHGGDVKLRENPFLVKAVRGPLTRKYLIGQGIDCPDVFGDPALLLPYFYKPHNTKKKYKLGVIPHYVDLQNISALRPIEERSDTVKIIELNNYKSWNDIIEYISECEFVISSSLHGLIISDAFSVPNMWIKIGENIKGGNFKYLDYFESVGRSTTEPLVIENNLRFNDIMAFKDKWNPICFSPKKLLNACPFKKDDIKL